MELFSTYYRTTCRIPLIAILECRTWTANRNSAQLRISYYMDQVREVLRDHYDAYRMELTNCQWIPRYIHYFGGKNNRSIGYG